VALILLTLPVSWVVPFTFYFDSFCLGRIGMLVHLLLSQLTGTSLWRRRVHSASFSKLTRALGFSYPSSTICISSLLIDHLLLHHISFPSHTGS
jgi:hypothetical protein